MKSNPMWAELIQLVPVVSLAFPIVMSGNVDLSSMGTAFVVATALAVVVHGLIWFRGLTLNPILVGTALWLAAGALAFGVPIAPLANLIAHTQALGIFAAALCVGVVTTAASPAGYIGMRSVDTLWVRQASLGLLALTALIVAWAAVFQHDVRLGGGLPFIVLNVARRAAIARHR